MFARGEGPTCKAGVSQANTKSIQQPGMVDTTPFAQRQNGSTCTIRQGHLFPLWCDAPVLDDFDKISKRDLGSLQDFGEKVALHLCSQVLAPLFIYSHDPGQFGYGYCSDGKSSPRATHGFFLMKRLLWQKGHAACGPSNSMRNYGKSWKGSRSAFDRTVAEVVRGKKGMDERRLKIGK